jgi:ABC-2 type transport system permease protein
MDVWLAAFFVFSGYVVPVELFPSGMRRVIDWLPFRYQIGLPVEIMTAAHDRADALVLLGRQWLFVALFFAIATILWRRGLSRFASFGG